MLIRGPYLFLEQLKMKFQLCYIFFLKPAVGYSQIPAKGRERLKRLERKTSPARQRFTGSRALGSQLGLANGLLCDNEHMAFTVKKFLKKHIREGNIKPQTPSFGEGQRKGKLISYLTSTKTTQKVLTVFGNWKLQLMGKKQKKKIIAVGHTLPSMEKFSQSWQKEKPPSLCPPQNTLWWVSTPP